MLRHCPASLPALSLSYDTIYPKEPKLKMYHEKDKLLSFTVIPPQPSASSLKGMYPEPACSLFMTEHHAPIKVTT